MKKFERYSLISLHNHLFSGPGEIQECGECDSCGRRLAVLGVNKVAEQSGGESHLEAYWYLPKDVRFCPFCGAEQEE